MSRATPWITGRIVELIANLGEELEESGAGPVCWIGAAPGALVAWDSCTECGRDVCGKAYVVVSQVVEYENFPNPAEFRQGGYPLGLAYTLEVGAIRCMPLMEDGEPLPSGDSLTTVIAQNDDMMAMLCAIKDTFSDDLLSITQYSPQGPEGGCVGGAWEFVVAP